MSMMTQLTLLGSGNRKTGRGCVKTVNLGALWSPAILSAIWSCSGFSNVRSMGEKLKMVICSEGTMRAEKNKIFNNKSEKDISRGAGSGPAIIFSGQILLSPWAVNMRPCEGITHDDDYHFSEKSLGEKRQEKINSPR